jgi:hypothetical protein
MIPHYAALRGIKMAWRWIKRSNISAMLYCLKEQSIKNFTGEYLGEFETEFENILGC